MSDLIDRAAAIEVLGEPHPLDYNRISAVEKIRELPSVEAVPMRRGKWIMKDSGAWQECSVCGVAVEVDSMYMCKASEDTNFNYCPHCGAKMGRDDQ